MSFEGTRGWTRRRLLGGATALALWPRGALARAQGAGSVDGTLPVLDASQPGGIDLHIERARRRVGDREGEVYTYNGGFPGPVIRMKEGEPVEIRVHNHLDEPTSIHWHGILLPYTMDGVPGISFEGIAPKETFTYRYRLRQSGTYWYHSHTGFQEQLGHHGQLVVEPKEAEPFDYDVEHSIVLGDWTTENPSTIFSKLKKIEGYFNFQRPTIANLAQQAKNSGKTLLEASEKRWRWSWMRMDPTDLLDVTGATYSYLINGKTPEENPGFIAEPGQRVRLRVANTSAMTFFDVRIPGVPMTVVQADGQNVQPVEVDELRIAVAETYDVLVTLPDSTPRTLFAETMDRSGHARATLGPALGMTAPVPPRRPRPMLGMKDMGMMMAGMDMSGSNGKMDMGSKDGAMDMSGKGEDMGVMNMSAEEKSMGAHDGTLPIQGLPDQVKHGPDTHGPGSITMAKTAYRQLDDPGPGLGNDGWRVLTYGKLKALHPPPDRRAPTRQIDLHLTGNMDKYIWGFDGKKWSESDMLQFKYGERLRINFHNDTMMTHPMHLHGMWMDLYAGHDYGENPRKHTLAVQPAELLTVDVTVDAPGQWAFHCHLLYHMEAGMFRTVAVVRELSEEPPRAAH